MERNEKNVDLRLRDDRKKARTVSPLLLHAEVSGDL